MFTLTWQIISDELNSTEFLVTLSLGRAHIRMTSHICEERDSKVIKKIDWVLSTSVSPKLRKLLGSEAVSCWVTVSIYWATALLSHYYAKLYVLHYYVEPLALGWVNCGDYLTHIFCLFSIIFRLPGQRAQSTHHLLPFLRHDNNYLISKIKSGLVYHVPVHQQQVLGNTNNGNNTSNLSHCAICSVTALFFWATTHADFVESLLYYSQPMHYYFEPITLCRTTCASCATCHQ